MVAAKAIHPTHPVGAGAASVYLRPSPVVIGLDTFNTSLLDVPGGLSRPASPAGPRWGSPRSGEHLPSPPAGEFRTPNIGDSRVVAEPVPGDDVATYEIRIRGELPPSLRERLSALMVHQGETETVLYREVADMAELDLLLDQLQSLGLTLSELQVSSPRSSDAPTSSPGSKE